MQHKYNPSEVELMHYRKVFKENYFKTNFSVENLDQN